MKKLFQAMIVVAIIFIAGSVHAQVTVGWDSYAEQSSITEFRLYLSTTSGGTATPIKITPVSLTQYTIPRSAIPAGKVYARLTAYDSVSAQESDPSNEISFFKNLLSPQNLRIK